jgi:hypothetical protein
MYNGIVVFIVIVLFISALYSFIAHFVLHRFLVKRGVEVIYGLSGLVSYLERQYLKADKSVRSSRIDRLIVSLKVSFWLMVITALALFIIIRMNGAGP